MTNRILVLGWSVVVLTSSLKASDVLLREDVSTESVQKLQDRYTDNLKSLEKSRATFKAQWAAATSVERPKIIKEARQVSLKAFYSEIFPAWFGTEWNFHGTTQTPGEGTIACGYFVTTCLKHAGFQCERVKLAQQASQKIIRTFAESKTDVSVSSDLPMETFLERIKESGEGLYIVGLDTHTGFVAWDGKTFAFIHSSYYRPPFSVTAEAADGGNPLKDSRYRMIGKILGDTMIKKWITGEPFPMSR